MARTTTQTQDKPVTVETETKPTETVTVETETVKTPKATDKVEVVNTTLANKSVYGVNGLIEFDDKGKALVSLVEAEHFAKIPGYKVGK